MSLKERLNEDIKSALKGGAKERLGVLRLIAAAIKQREVDERTTLTDDDVLVVLDKMVKQRRESVAQYEKAGRQDLIDQENFEIQVIQVYLPAPLSETEIDVLIEQAIAETAAASIKDMGKVMGLLKPKMQGRADMGAVSGKIKTKLGG